MDYALQLLLGEIIILFVAIGTAWFIFHKAFESSYKPFDPGWLKRDVDKCAKRIRKS